MWLLLLHIDSMYNLNNKILTCDKLIFSGFKKNNALFFRKPGSPSCNTSKVFLPTVSNVSRPPLIILLPVVSTIFVIWLTLLRK